MESFHFDHKVFYLHQLNEPGEVREFDGPDILNLAAFGHTESACSGDAEKCRAIANGRAEAITPKETPDADPGTTRPDDAGGRPADAGPFLCELCDGKEFKSAAALGAHNSQKHKA